MAKQSGTSETAAARTADAADAGEAAKAKQLKLPAHVMYLGPTFIRNGVRFLHKQIFSNGVPDAWLEWIASEPEFRLLFAPVDKVAERLAALRNPDSPLSIAFRKAEAAARQYKPGK